MALIQSPATHICMALLVLCLAFGVGCGRDSADALMADVNSSNIQRLANLYSVYQIQHKFKGPKDEAELKAFIAQQDTGRLERIGIDPNELDSLFISTRDKQPFKVRWGLKGSSRQPAIPLVFESEGVDDKFRVAFSSFVVKEVEKPEYDLLWKGKVEKEAKPSRRN